MIDFVEYYSQLSLVHKSTANRSKPKFADCCRYRRLDRPASGATNSTTMHPNQQHGRQIALFPFSSWISNFCFFVCLFSCKFSEFWFEIRVKVVLVLFTKNTEKERIIKTDEWPDRSDIFHLLLRCVCVRNFERRALHKNRRLAVWGLGQRQPLYAPLAHTHHHNENIQMLFGAFSSTACAAAVAVAKT